MKDLSIVLLILLPWLVAFGYHLLRRLFFPRAKNILLFVMLPTLLISLHFSTLLVLGTGIGAYLIFGFALIGMFLCLYHAITYEEIIFPHFFKDYFKLCFFIGIFWYVIVSVVEMVHLL